jgi:hypothetical protein
VASRRSGNFQDSRLATRFRTLLDRLWRGIGQSKTRDAKGHSSHGSADPVLNPGCLSVNVLLSLEWGNAMEDENIKASTALGTRRPRQGEAFWGEMVTTWKASGIGARRFCREQGLAVSTFSLWCKKLSGPVKERKQPFSVTADAAFIVSKLNAELASRGPSVATPTADASPSRDRVTLSLAGVRIELSGVHAERIVRFVLGQLGGGRC